LEKADILEMTVRHLQRLHEQKKRQQEQCLKQVTTRENGDIASPTQQGQRQPHTWQESFITTDTHIKHEDEYNAHKLCNPSSTVPDTMHGSQKESTQTTTTKQSVSSCMQKSYYEELSCSRFRAGFSECAREAWKFLIHSADVDISVRERLSKHLASRLDSLEDRDDVTSSCSNHQAADSTQNIASETARVLSSVSPPILIQTPSGFTLLPTKLANGDLVFVIPADVNKSVTACLQSKSAHAQDGVVWRPW
jgi:hypothetical protein